MLFAWVVCLGGYAAVAFVPDEYEAQALVHVNVTSRLGEVIGGVAIEWDIADQLERVRQQMLNLPVLEAVARETDLDLRATTPEAKNALLRSLQETIGIAESRPRTPDPRQATDTVWTISFSHQSRAMAIRVVDTLLETFVRDVIKGGQGDSEQAQAFLEAEIARYTVILQEREQAVAAFKREHIGLLPGQESGDYFQELQTSMQALEAVEAELRAARRRSDALRAQLTSTNPELPPGARSAGGTAINLPPGPLADLQARITNLEQTRDELLLNATDAHPEVKRVNRLLDGLYEELRVMIAELAVARGSEFEGSALSTNPVYQDIQIALNQVKTEIAGLESEVEDQRRAVEDLQAKVEIMPQVAAELTQLQRGYEEARTLHAELVRRAQQESLGSAAVSDDVNFTILQPPVADFIPSAPQRLLLLAVVLVVAIGAAGGFAFLVSQFRPVFSTTRELRAFAGLPVLGGVREVQNAGQELRRKLQIVSIGLASVLLLIVYALGVVMRDEAAIWAQSLIA
jgi:polysaccharide chain length determinant protein (PEP-CTERM system associated)